MKLNQISIMVLLSLSLSSVLGAAEGMFDYEDLENLSPSIVPATTPESPVAHQKQGLEVHTSAEVKYNSNQALNAPNSPVSTTAHSESASESDKDTQAELSKTEASVAEYDTKQKKKSIVSANLHLSRTPSCLHAHTLGVTQLIPRNIEAKLATQQLAARAAQKQAVRILVQRIVQRALTKEAVSNKALLAAAAKEQAARRQAVAPQRVPAPAQENTLPNFPTLLVPKEILFRFIELVQKKEPELSPYRHSDKKDPYGGYVLEAYGVDRGPNAPQPKKKAKKKPGEELGEEIGQRLNHPY